MRFILLMHTYILKAMQPMRKRFTDSYRKSLLSSRGKKVNGRRVQRDLYSSFLLKHKDTVEHPDREECTKDFGNFLKKQGHVVNQVRKKGDTTKNFGLEFFIS